MILEARPGACSAANATGSALLGKGAHVHYEADIDIIVRLEPQEQSSPYARILPDSK